VRDPNQLSLEWSPPPGEGTAPSSTPVPQEVGEADGREAIASPLVTPTVAATLAPMRRKPGAATARPGGSKRIIARIPVPRPLPAAVAAGRFGQDEDGRPIRPASDEVRAITEQHAEKLIDLLVAATAVVESGSPTEQARLRDAFGIAVADFAEDFGPRPAQQLEAYVRRQAELDSDDTDGARRR